MTEPRNVSRVARRPHPLGPLAAQSPRTIPALSVMLADLGQPSAAHLGAYLGAHPRTVARWLARGQAPRPATLALFWLTRWGRSQIDAQAVNDAALAWAVARAETTRAARLAAALDAAAGAAAVD